MEGLIEIDIGSWMCSLFQNLPFKVFSHYYFYSSIWLHQVLVAACGIFLAACGIFSSGVQDLF